MYFPLLLKKNFMLEVILDARIHQTACVMFLNSGKALLFCRGYSLLFGFYEDLPKPLNLVILLFIKLLTSWLPDSGRTVMINFCEIL